MIDFLINKIKKLYRELVSSDFGKNIVFWQQHYQKKIDIFGKKLSKQGINANIVTIFGFIIGIMAINFLAMNMYFEALICILVNRFCDLLDGAVARHEGATSFGVFLDASLDFIFYAGVIFGFALANPEENAISACFLLFGFTASATSMLAYGIVAYKASKSNETLKQSPFYLGGLAQGFETTTAFVLLCLMPFAFLPIAIALGCWCLIKALVIVSSAYYQLVISAKSKR